MTMVSTCYSQPAAIGFGERRLGTCLRTTEDHVDHRYGLVGKRQAHTIILITWRSLDRNEVAIDILLLPFLGGGEDHWVSSGKASGRLVGRDREYADIRLKFYLVG